MNKLAKLKYLPNNFEIIEEGDHVICAVSGKKIPLEKFLNPYEVYFTEKDDTSLDQLDKIRKTEFSQDETHVSISFRTNSEGTVSIVGATPEEHQKRLEQN